MLQYPECMVDTMTKSIDECERLMQNIAKLVDCSEQILRRYKSVQRRSRELIKHKLLENHDKKDHYGVGEFDKIYIPIRDGLLLKREVTEKQKKDLLKGVYNCLKRRDQLMRNEEYLRMQR